MSRLQSVDALTEQRHQIGQREDQGGHVSSSPWLTTHEACDYLRFTGKCRLRSLYAFLKEHGIPTGRRGKRTLMIARLDLDRAVRGGR